jgi:hypothetical protein
MEILKASVGKLAKGVTMPVSVDLLPGDYVLTFAVLDNLAGTIGTLSAPLKVP